MVSWQNGYEGSPVKLIASGNRSFMPSIEFMQMGALQIRWESSINVSMEEHKKDLPLIPSFYKI